MVKSWFVAIFILLFSPFSGFAQTNLSNNYVISLADDDLNGRWHLVMSNSRFWKKAKRSDIIIDFTISADKTIEELIEYKQKGKMHSIRLSSIRTSPSHFVSKPVSGMHFFKNYWYAVAMDAGKQWLVIYHVNGLFRRESVDVISRSASFSERENEQFQKLCGENYFLKAKTSHMSMWISH
ncbi:MAG TPA: hypothetical protein VGO45_07360 [Bacteroidia bacterium]|jgi:hypothetical protein|nr:hypothetical protein [Bacteroidia bacterium]